MENENVDSSGLTVFNCWGQFKTITLSWSRLQDWMKCKQRVKLLHTAERSPTNVRNFLAGNLTDHTMRHALENAEKDEEGKLIGLSEEELLAPLPAQWEKELSKNSDDLTHIVWRGDPESDQRTIYKKAKLALRRLHPILNELMVGRRYIPELRPKEMPIVGIPGPDGEDFHIRMYLAVDLAVQLEKGPLDGDGDEQVGKWGIYDLKTTESSKYLQQTMRQLVFYDIAWQALTGERAVDWALIAPLVSGDKVIRLNVTDDDRVQLMSLVTQYVHSVMVGEDDFTDNASECYNCPVKMSCIRGNPARGAELKNGKLKVRLGSYLPERKKDG